MINCDKYKNKKITLSETSEKKTEMSFYELSRWMSLIEGIEHVDKKCKQLKISDRNNCWVKPNALQKYVDERYQSMLFEITDNDTIC